MINVVSPRWPCVLLLLLATRYDYTAFAFAPLVAKTLHTTQHHHRHNGSSRIAPLFAASTSANTGGGVPLVKAGNRALFDPATAGRLDGASSTLNERIQKGAAYQFRGDNHYLSASSPLYQNDNNNNNNNNNNAILPPGANLQEAQHWLLEDSSSSVVPAVFAKATAPVQATVLQRYRLIGPTAEGDIEHVLLQLPQGMHYVEGQSLSVIPPGQDENNRPHKPRLYSIASTRYGDLLDGNTVSLCVRHAQYKDPVTGRIDESKNGICSTFLCHVQPGTSVSVAGPVGKTMLLPPADKLAESSTDLIMVATGTGIAPFRGFLRRLFVENTVARHMFQGKVWLVLGVPTSDNLLYQDEFHQMLDNAKNDRSNSGKNADGAAALEVTYAISREMVSPVTGTGKCYVQDILASRASELLERLEKGAVIYFCGLKGMMPGILDALEQSAQEKRNMNASDWKAFVQQLKANGQWHVEVY